MKHCNKCNTDKPFSDFHKDKSKLYGLSSICKICDSIGSKARYEKNKERILSQCREARLKREFGIGVSEFEMILQSQDGKCAICGSSSNYANRNMCIDHNHETGAVRGVLCSSCNTGLGLLKDSPENVLSAYQYLINKGHYGQERYETS